MTSPNQPEPSSGFDRYDTVHSKGSTFGSDLTEASVRNLLMGRIKSPFAQAVENFAGKIGEVVGGIADAIRGEGAGYEVVSDAVTTRLGPINTAISESGERFTELATKAEGLIKTQGELLEKTDQQGQQVQRALADAKEAIDELEAYKNSNAQDIAGYVEKAEQALTRADKANSDLDSLTKSFASRVEEQIKQSTTVSDIQGKAKDALADAEMATDWIRNGAQVSSSLIALEPGTTTPLWQTPLVKFPNGTSSADADLPDGISHYFRPREVVKAGAAESVPMPDGGYVSVDSRLEYEASCWVRSTSNHSRYIYVTMSDDTGNRRIVEKLPATDRDPEPSKYTWGNPVRMIIAPVSTKWTRYTTRFKFREGVTAARIENVYFSNTSSQEEDAWMFIAGLEVSPKIPTQSDVDAAQNKAIESHDLLFDKQKGWNTTQEKINKLNGEMWDDQGRVNGALEEASHASIQAIKALNRPNTADNVLPYLEPSDEEVINGSAEYDVPVWTTAAPHKVKLVEGTAKLTGSDYAWGNNDGVQRTLGAQTVYFSVNPKQEYKLSFYCYGSVSDILFYWAVRDQNGQHAIKKVTPVGGKFPGDLGTDHSYLLGEFSPGEGWGYYEAIVEFNPEVYKARTAVLYWNHPGGTGSGRMLFNNVTLRPNIPTQEDVNNALRNADDALAEQQELQRDFNREQIRVNRLTQEQLWNHQDMIELLDIQSMRQYGIRIPQDTHLSTNVYLDETNIADYNHYGTQWFSIWATDRSVTVRAEGGWIGTINVRNNFNSGAVDDWVLDVTPEKRVFILYGGALHLKLRHVAVQVIPASLSRQSTMDLVPARSMTPVHPDGNSYMWDRAGEDLDLFRLSYPERIRFKNVVTCDKDVYARDETDNPYKIPAGQRFGGVQLFPEDQKRLGTYTFFESRYPALGRYRIPEWRAQQAPPVELQA